MLPSNDQLRCFIAAAETLNFRRAARVLAITPGALSQRVRQLEETLGATLFRRTTRTVSLTPAGHALLPYARRALAAAQDCLRAVRGELGTAPFDLTLGCPHELAAHWIIPHWARLARARPEVSLHLSDGLAEELPLRVRTRDLDACLTDVAPLDPRLDAIVVRAIEHARVAARSLLRRGPLSSPDDAPRHAFVDVTARMPLYQRWFEGLDASVPWRFSRTLLVGSVAAVIPMVLRGDGASTLPLAMVADALAADTLRELTGVGPRPTSTLRLLFRAEDPRRPVYESLARTLAELPWVTAPDDAT